MVDASPEDGRFTVRGIVEAPEPGGDGGRRIRVGVDDCGQQLGRDDQS